MEVFVIVKDTRYETEAENDVRVFGRLEEAKADLQEMCRIYREDAKKDGWFIDKDDPENFEAYIMGYECENHYYFNIYSKTI